ncbi:energy transducer TonB [Aliikangiella sp. G2MR2-5]|uniref:energy transducer TonB n=1 Tax=Aliikangiella sp. G2MR2-5 TaxID=2788943 RepID=UPI0018AC0481|nr:energy transducer TonB [Aliikangiella sp. G2MR2-5]
MHRILTGLGIGSSITVALFALMSFLIKSNVELPEDEVIPPVDFSMKIDEKPLELIDRKPPEKKELPKEPPPPKTTVSDKPNKPELKTINFKVAGLKPGLKGDTYLGKPGGHGGVSDGDAIPMVVIQPTYPRKPAMEGVEGWVKFKFTIATDGTPKDIEVVDANPRKTFEKAARKAIYKWKFKPRIVDGRPVEQPNMTYTLNFKLAGE